MKALEPRKNGKKRNLDETDKMEARKRMAERLVPKYVLGGKVRFPSHDGEEWFHGTIQELILPGDPRNTLDHPHVILMYLIEHGDTQGNIYLSVIEEDLIERKIRSVQKKGKTTLVVKISLANALHDLDLVGIDTCSAVSVSTEKDDFIFIDESRKPVIQ